MPKYMAIAKTGRNWSGDVFTMVSVGPGERAPEGFTLLGKPEDTRGSAIKHAIAFLQMEAVALNVMAADEKALKV